MGILRQRAFAVTGYDHVKLSALREVLTYPEVTLCTYSRLENFEFSTEPVLLRIGRVVVQCDIGSFRTLSGPRRSSDVSAGRCEFRQVWS